MDTGGPVPEPVSVGLNCGMRSLQMIRTDLKGYFQFTLGAGPQGNIDFSGSNDSPVSPAGDSLSSPGGGYRGFGGPGGSLTGCELRISVPGYQPLSKTITDPADLRGIDVGTLRLTRIAGVAGSSISVTSLLVPNNARKEFENGDKDVRSNHLVSATRHLEKAVSEYDKYAAAWNELGDIYATNREIEKSRQAFENAITADPKYIRPYVGLADLELQNQEFEAAVVTAGLALELDHSIGVASFIQAVGNFKLNRLDAAEKSAQEAEKGPHQNMPELHALLADIFLRQQDYSNAAAQMRAYLKEFPKGKFAGEMQKSLQQIEKSAANADSKSDPSPAQPQTAP
jgi:tetratricopeptide (TPR) repeat protein